MLLADGSARHMIVPAGAAERYAPRGPLTPTAPRVANWYAGRDQAVKEVSMRNN
jgi:hypothetical protein